MFKYGQSCAIQTNIGDIAWSIGQAITPDTDIPISIYIDNTANTIPVTVYLEGPDHKSAGVSTMIITIPAQGFVLFAGLPPDQGHFIQGMATSGVNVNIAAWTTDDLHSIFQGLAQQLAQLLININTLQHQVETIGEEIAMINKVTPLPGLDP